MKVSLSPGIKELKIIVIFEISTLVFDKHEFLTYAMNFGIGSLFSKGLRYVLQSMPI